MHSATVAPFKSLPCSSSRRCRSGIPHSHFFRFYQRQSKVFRLQATEPDPEQMKKIQETMNEAMQNPQVRERVNQMQEAFKDPQVRQQLEQTMEYMKNEETQKRIRELRDDPELKEKFDEIQKGGLGAMMKAMNDMEFLEKIGRRVGAPPTISQSPPPVTKEAPVAPPVDAPVLPEINTLLDAAKYGDVEAAEDFLAIGKDPNLADEFGRTPLHFAVSIQSMEIVEALISSGANLETKDSKQNTPLHYAVGYGRVEAVKRLLKAGADGSVKNETGKTPAELAKLSDQNPVLEDKDLINKLDELAKSSTESE
eukprot:g753.t1